MPAAVARGALRAHAGDRGGVLDPFCHGASAWTHAANTGRPALGVARHRGAYLEAWLRTHPPDPREVAKRLRELRNDMFYGDPDAAPFPLRMRFPARARGQLVHLRDHLDPARVADAALLVLVTSWMAPGGPRLSDPPKDQDVFETLALRLDRWRSRASRPLEGRLWEARGGRIGPALAETLREQSVSLILGAVPPPRGPASSEAQVAVDWFLRADGEAGQAFLRQWADVPGILDLLEKETRMLHEILLPGGVCALWLDDVTLPGRGRRTVRMAERLWRKLEEGQTPFHFEGIEDRLLVLRK